MSFLVGGSSGLSILETEALAALDYDPVVGGCAEEDGRIFWEIVPDSYRILADQEMLPEIWAGYVQVVSDLMLQLMCADAATNIVEVPLDFQRKYQHIDYDFPKIFLTPPEDILFYNQGASDFLHSQSDLAINATWRSNLAASQAYWELTSGVDQRASLRWSWRASYSRIDLDSAVAFVGYYSKQTATLANSLLAGIGDGGRVIVAQFDANGNANVLRSPVVVALNEQVDVEVTYDGANRLVSVDVTRVSDSVVLLSEFQFSTFDGAYLDTFTADAFGLISLNLSTEPGAAPEFRPLDTGRAVVGTLSQLSFMDPSIADNVQDIPFLQDRWCNPIVFWTRDKEYDLLENTGGHRFLAFKEQPLSFLLAEYVSYDLELIRKNYGEDVGLVGDNSFEYKTQVQALHYALWKGPTVGSIRLGIQVLLGLPFSAVAGEVIAVNPAYSGDEGEIVIQSSDGNRAYRYPREVNATVSVGDQISQFQALTDGVEIRDWISDPDWFKSYVGSNLGVPSPGVFGAAIGYQDTNKTPVYEIEKYHTFAAAVDAAIFKFGLQIPIEEFVNRIKPTWKSFLFTVIRKLVDDVTIDDPLKLYMVMRLRDSAGGGLALLDPRYGDPITYQQPNPEIYYGMVGQLFPGNNLTLTWENTSGSPATFDVVTQSIEARDGDTFAFNLTGIPTGAVHLEPWETRPLVGNNEGDHGWRANSRYRWSTTLAEWVNKAAYDLLTAGDFTVKAKIDGDTLPTAETPAWSDFSAGSYSITIVGGRVRFHAASGGGTNRASNYILEGGSGLDGHAIYVYFNMIVDSITEGMTVDFGAGDDEFMSAGGFFGSGDYTFLLPPTGNQVDYTVQRPVIGQEQWWEFLLDPNTEGVKMWIDGVLTGTVASSNLWTGSGQITGSFNANGEAGTANTFRVRNYKHIDLGLQ